MEYKVLRFDRENNYHVCRARSGEVVKFDLFTDASFDYENIADDGEICEALVGKTITIESRSPYVQCYFAENVKIIDEPIDKK